MTIFKGLNITDLDAVPRKLIGNQCYLGKLRQFPEAQELLVANAIIIGDTMPLAELPSNCKMNSIRLRHDVIDVNQIMRHDIGIYNGPNAFTDSTTDTSYSPFEVIDQTAFASDLADFGSATTLDGVERLYENRDTAQARSTLWMDAGLGEDPLVPLRIVVTVTVAPTDQQTGTLNTVMLYSTLS